MSLGRNSNNSLFPIQTLPAYLPTTVFILNPYLSNQSNRNIFLLNNFTAFPGSHPHSPLRVLTSSTSSSSKYSISPSLRGLSHEHLNIFKLLPPLKYCFIHSLSSYCPLFLYSQTYWTAISKIYPFYHIIFTFWTIVYLGSTPKYECIFFLSQQLIQKTFSTTTTLKREHNLINYHVMQSLLCSLPLPYNLP